MRCYFFLRQAVTVTCFRKNKKVTKTGRVFMTPFSRVSDTLLCHPAFFFFEDFPFGFFVVFQSTPFSENDICPKCKIQYSAGTVSNQLTVTMRRHIKEYYMVGQSNFVFCEVPIPFTIVDVVMLCFPGLAEMWWPVLWLPHTSGTPDPSSGCCYVPSML